MIDIDQLEKEINDLLEPITKEIGMQMKAYFKNGGMSIADAKEITAQFKFDDAAREIVEKTEDLIKDAKNEIKKYGIKMQLAPESYTVLENVLEMDLANILKTRESVVTSMVASGIKYNTNNITLNELSAQLEKYIDDLTRNARVEALNCVMIFDRTLMSEAYKEAGVEKFFYMGPWDEKTRDVCREALGSPNQQDGWTADEIEKSPVDFITGGGFNCRHQFIPWSEGLKIEDYTNA